MNNKKAFILALFAPLGQIFAGGIVSVDRVDLKNGKKIIFFSEKHYGMVNPQLAIADLCLNQFQPLSALFSSFINNKQAYKLLIEYSDGVRNINEESQRRLGEFRLAGCDHSWFDRFYLGVDRGRTEWPFIDSVQNFDQRTISDGRILNILAKFDRFYKKYENAGFTQLAFEQLKKEFIDSREYQGFLASRIDFVDFITFFEQRLAVHMQRLQHLLSQEDYKLLINAIDTRITMLPSYILLNRNAKFANMNFIDFLFLLTNIAKENFYTSLALHANSEFPINSVYMLGSFINVIADLSLLEAILIDPHPITLVSLGANHAHLLIENFFKKSSLVRSIRSLNMLNLNPDEAIGALFDFVHQP